MPILGLVGGLALWWATWRYGHFPAWPDLIEVDAGNHVWRRTAWHPEREAWRDSTLLALLAYALILAALSGLIAL